MSCAFHTVLWCFRASNPVHMRPYELTLCLVSPLCRCPFNWYRSSGDINAGTMSWFNNLQTTIRFQDWAAPVSRPGCWAYPDMLEVGRVQGSLEWNRAHFGAWCIVSAPLILGLELTPENLDPIIDIIGNKEALAVNQAWAGHPYVVSRPFGFSPDARVSKHTLPRPLPTLVINVIACMC
eukprot:m.111306 g.111306  ORF g.111306 m.111306 type:complete len:180 (+) comp10749_c0_seq2:141-680(+)